VKKVMLKYAIQAGKAEQVVYILWGLNKTVLLRLGCRSYVITRSAKVFKIVSHIFIKKKF